MKSGSNNFDFISIWHPNIGNPESHRILNKFIIAFSLIIIFFESIGNTPLDLSFLNINFNINNIPRNNPSSLTIDCVLTVTYPSVSSIFYHFVREYILDTYSNTPYIRFNYLIFKYILLFDRYFASNAYIFRYFLTFYPLYFGSFNWIALYLFLWEIKLC